MKIFTRKSRIYRNLVLALLWLGLLVYSLYAGEPFRARHIGYLFAGLVFAAWFYVELSRPYIVIEDGMITKGLFSKKSMALDDIEEWRPNSGVLVLAGKKKSLKIMPSRVSQVDMERIYEVLRARHTDEEADFRKEHGL